MDNLYLLAEAGHGPFAMPAAAIENVVREMEIVPVPLADPSVAGIAALRSRVVTVIDLMAAIAATPSSDCSGKPVIVTNVNGHLYGFAIDRVHDIVEAQNPPKPIEASMSVGWREATSGYVEAEGGALVVVEPERLLATLAKAA